MARRKSAQSIAERTAQVQANLPRARSPYWRERYKAGEPIQPTLRTCGKCGIAVPPEYGIDSAKRHTCEECRLTAWYEYVEALKAEGIWPPNEKHERAETNKIVEMATVEHFYLRAYEKLVELAGPPRHVMSSEGVVTLLINVQRYLEAMEAAIEPASADQDVGA